MHILLPFAITLCITLTTFASDILLPSIYKVSEYFSINSSIAQWSISIFFIGQLSGALFWGTLSDKYGSNKTLLASLLIVFLATVTCIIATTIHLFLMGRYLQGFGAIASPVIGWAMIQHYYPKEKAALIMSIIGGVLSIAPMLAPALGGYIDKFYNWRGCLYFILFLNIVVILNLIVLPNYKDGIVTNKGKNILKTYKSILLDKAFTSNILMFGILASGEWCFLTVIPVYFKQKYNIPSIQIGYLLSISASFYISGTFITSYLLKKISIDSVIKIGVILCVIASLILICFHFININSPLYTSLIFGFYLMSAALLWGTTATRALQNYTVNKSTASAARVLILIGCCAFGSFLGTIIEVTNTLEVSIFLLIFSLISLTLSRQDYMKENTA
ncbi:putative multidrug resistance protein, MFS superfamily [Legionella longbeachae NSW150]|uniref:Putative multidrug resistance protein, MFS superfamily n=1 Tax=Legionella longbeachae serogroup 1 (strain NSW150) TaxID=661367 RepID=D3HLN7_LEGLN|nr:MFS transporter [Legionella longbeachae]CBJ13357.1 putative multidrug resistance protein, MFS superfamily [Legionella longbeachae NSW150]